MVICSVYDSKLDAFLQPMAFPNVAVAIRMFQDLVNTSGSDFSKFPEDYTLFEIGTWEEKEGKLLPHATPKSVVLASLLVRKPEV